MFRAIRPQRSEDAEDSNQVEADRSFKWALELTEGTYKVALRRFADPNILPFLHVVLAFIHHLAFFPAAITVIEKTFPWKLVSLLLNSLLLSYREYDKMYSTEFPRPDKGLPRPLPEDFAMKGLIWVDKYFPNDWFSNEKIDDDEKYFEVASMTDERKERILWLGCAIAKQKKWLVYDENLHLFGVVDQYEKEVEDITKDPEMMNLSETSDTISQASTFATTTTSEKGDQEMLDVDDFAASTPTKLVAEE